MSMLWRALACAVPFVLATSAVEAKARPDIYHAKVTGGKAVVQGQHGPRRAAVLWEGKRTGVVTTRRGWFSLTTAIVPGDCVGRLTIAGRDTKVKLGNCRMAATAARIAAPAAVPGPQGPQGLQGEPGAAGPQGEKGEKGDVGPQGDVGPAGPMGPQGVAGPKGEPGAIGPKGDVGPAGPQGEPGAKGETGAVGPAGAQGAVGQKGDAGPAGPKGESGQKGDKGDKGEPGPQGAAGALTPMHVAIEGSFVRFTRAPAREGGGTMDYACAADRSTLKEVDGFVARTIWALKPGSSCEVPQGTCDTAGACQDMVLELGCYVRKDIVDLVDAAKPQMSADDKTRLMCSGDIK